jgi:hypothetical protein
MMMLYKVRLRKWLDDSVSIVSKEELSNLHTKAYHAYVKDVFVEHQNCMGQDIEEAEDAFSDQPFKTIEKFLLKSGYDLKNDFLYRNS